MFVAEKLCIQARSQLVSPDKIVALKISALRDGRDLVLEEAERILK
jgi:hypothetical protein